MPEIDALLDRVNARSGASTCTRTTSVWAFRFCSVVGKRMTDGDGGSIINISAVGSIRPDRIALPYSAAKAALDALTVRFAQAYASNVRVSTVMPGPFLTDVTGAIVRDDGGSAISPLI